MKKIAEFSFMCMALLQDCMCVHATMVVSCRGEVARQPIVELFHGHTKALTNILHTQA